MFKQSHYKLMSFLLSMVLVLSMTPSQGFAQALLTMPSDELIQQSNEELFALEEQTSDESELVSRFVDQALADFPSDANQGSIASALFDAVIDRFELSLDSAPQGAAQTSVLSAQSLDAAGITHAYQLVLNHVGIDSRVVSGGESPWLLVHIDDAWYHADPVSAIQSASFEQVPHDWLLRSDEMYRQLTGRMSWSYVDGSGGDELPECAQDWSFIALESTDESLEDSSLPLSDNSTALVDELSQAGSIIAQSELQQQGTTESSISELSDALADPVLSETLAEPSFMPIIDGSIEHYDSVKLIREGHNPYDEGPSVVTTALLPEGSVTKKEKQLWGVLYDGLTNHSDQIYLTSLELLYSDAKEFKESYERFLHQHPELFFVAGGYRYSYRSVNGKQIISYIKPQYFYDAATTKSMTTKYYNAFKTMLSWVPASASQVEQIKAVHDYLVRTIAYNMKAADLNSTGWKSTYGNLQPWDAYGALVNKSSVCEGYTEAFIAGMQYLGVECDRALETTWGGAHVWNQVKLGGNWYQVDCTYDDPLIGNNKDQGNVAVTITDYFLKSSTKIKSYREDYHLAWSPSYSNDKSTTYDSKSASSWTQYRAPVSSSIPYVTNISLSTGNATTVSLNKTKAITITPTPSTAKNFAVSWSTSDASIAYVDASNVIHAVGAGSATIKCVVNGITKSFTVNVTDKPLINISSGTVSLSASSFVYNGSARKPTVTVSYAGKKLTEGNDYTVSWPTDVTSVGTKTIKITGDGEYTGTLSKSYAITKASLGSLTLSQASYSFTGSAITPSITVRDSANKVLTKDTDYTVSCKNNTAVGSETATVTVSGKNNYEGTLTKKFSIIKASLSAANISIGSEVYSYTGTEVRPNATVTLNGKTLKEGTDYTKAYSNNTQVGTATVTVTGIGNYSGTTKASYTIASASDMYNITKSATISLPTASTTYTYANGKLSPEPSPTVRAGTTTLKLGTDYTVSYQVNTSSKKATLTIAGKGLYKGSKSITFDIAIKVETVPMYRLYNPNSGEHFYTASAGERDLLKKVGWKYEGVGWNAPKTSSTPVYRLYNPNSGDHHYTTNAGEKNMLMGVGWKYEGIGWYSDVSKGVALYRQYNPNCKGAGSHNYTSNKAENDMLIRIGWKGEGIGWYGVKG
ncbi:MAG: hypothetical protein IJ125_02445 [Atopobiaceae bacterium]|nr:hypothetical protein [Atopobiaceae bacterium]